MVPGGKHEEPATDDTRPTADLSSATARIGDESGPPYIGTYLYNDPDDEDDARYALAHQRRPLWLPLVIFVLLLAAGGVVGQYLLRRDEPVVGAIPDTTRPRATGGVAVEPPLLPDLPTPPARPADALADWARRVSPAVDIPAVAVEAYGYAQLLLQRDDPACHLNWTTLAGVGEVESHHGQRTGSVLQPNGRSSPQVAGPLLNGVSGAPLVRDSDAGAYDGDATFDRAMGPLLLLPSAWGLYAADADGDGIQDPYDIDDAAVALGRLLCAGSEDLGQLAGWSAALARLSAGTAYAKSVFSAADNYGQRSKSIG